MSPHPSIQSDIPALILFCMILFCMMLIGMMIGPISAAQWESAGGSGTGAFIDAGCIAYGGELDCSSIGLDEQYGCMQITTVPKALENLTPLLPMVECLYQSQDYSAPEGSEGILREGCMMPVYRRYIVRQGLQFVSIASTEKFRSMFAPVESEDEALAFAVALTGSFADYSPSAPDGYFAVAPSVGPTYAKETNEGYIVRLFDRQLCGCGSHPYYAVIYMVTRDGNVTETSREAVFDSSNNICVD
jgi:hypothetical protein